MKRTHSAYWLITLLAWLTAFSWSPAQTAVPAAKNTASSPVATAAAKPNSPLNYTFDDSPLDRSNREQLSSYSDILDKVTPAVVGVYPSQLARPPRQRNSLRAQQLEQYLQQMGVTPPSQSPSYLPPSVWTDALGANYRKIGTGSGCIISSDGYILTNNHVVSDDNDQLYDAVLVKLSDGRELPAKIIGTDKGTDLALIKIDAQNLPTVKMANSDKLRVGDVVFAIGNPMDVGMTVTHGIVSALGRSSLGLLDDSDPQTGAAFAGFENFIQTDASINPGNSGGPLVDAQGRLVGLNSVIESTSSGGSIGIGFAIPSVLARHVADDLIKDGKVRRGVLGVSPKDLDHNLAQNLNLPNTRGALLNEITVGSPAAKSGLKPDDVVIKINNDEVDSAGKLRYLIALADPGTTVDLTVLRDGKPQVVKVLLGDRDQMIQEANRLAPVRNDEPMTLADAIGRASRNPSNTSSTPASGDILAGLALTPVTPDLRQQLSLASDVNGLVVTDVARNSPFAYEFSIGTVIMQVNKQPVATVEELRAALKPGELNLFYVNRKDASGTDHTAIVTMMVPGAGK